MPKSVRTSTRRISRWYLKTPKRSRGSMSEAIKDELAAVLQRAKKELVNVLAKHDLAGSHIVEMDVYVMDLDSFDYLAGEKE